MATSIANASMPPSNNLPPSEHSPPTSSKPAVDALPSGCPSNDSKPRRRLQKMSNQPSSLSQRSHCHANRIVIKWPVKFACFSCFLHSTICISRPAEEAVILTGCDFFDFGKKAAVDGAGALWTSPPTRNRPVLWQRSSPFSNPLLFVIPSAARDLQCALRGPHMHRAPQYRHPERSASPIYRKRTAFGAESKDPGDACWQMLLKAFRPRSSPEYKKSHRL